MSEENIVSKKVGYVFIDASNLWASQKVKGKMFDFEKLKNFLNKTYDLTEIRVYYYTAYPKEGTRDYNTQKKHNFFTYLKKSLNINVVKKELKQIIESYDTNGYPIKKEKGNMDVEMTIDCVHNVNRYDIAILFTGDSDFLAVINYIRSKSKQAFIYSSKNNVSNELRTGSDGFIDILKINEDIWGKDIQYKEQKISDNL
jgi:uncharacterized LabA/DUF88 family protein